MLGSLLKVAVPVSEDSGDNPLWLIVLCDLMTNLMLFFLVLYSFSLKSEAEKQQAMQEVQNAVTGKKIEHKALAPVAPAMEAEKAAAVLKEFEKAGLKDLAQVDVTESRIRIRMAAPVLFPSGAAELGPGARRRLAPVARLLRGLEAPVVVEGYTDDVPIRSGPFHTNWELSVARATAVIRHLAKERGLGESRFVAAGYGEYRPIADNGTAEGRARNRRIEIVVMRKSSLAVLGKTGAHGAGEERRRNEFRKSLGR